jgi:hypothetical protein
LLADVAKTFFLGVALQVEQVEALHARRNIGNGIAEVGLVAAGSDVVAVTDTARVGVDVVTSVAALAVATPDRVALGLRWVAVFRAAAVRAMTQALPDARHASEATELGQSKIVYGRKCISRPADDAQGAALLRCVAQRVAH